MNTVVSASKHKGSYTILPDEQYVIGYNQCLWYSWEGQMKKLEANYTVIDNLVPFFC